MRTAIDTNVVSAVWSGEASAAKVVAQLDAARAEGALQVCPAVLAELYAYPGANAGFIRRFFEATGILVDFRLDEPVWSEAGERFARYAMRRRKSPAGSPRRLLTDFLIGAHALVQADRLMTLDPDVYRKDFPELRLL